MDSTLSGTEKLSIWQRPDRLAWIALIFFNVIVGLAAFRHIIQSNIDADEAEHAHVAWATHNGIMPYRDIHQIHMPMLWMISSPLFGILPENAYSLVALRFLCLAAFLGTYLAGLAILKEMFGPINREHRLLLLLFCLSVLPPFEWYRFRPDPFMTFFASWAIVAAVRLGRNPLLYSTLGGLALGIAATFSTKMAPLCLLIPALCVFESCRSRSFRPLLYVFPLGVGFLVGLLPAVIWLFYYELFDSFIYWTIKVNAHAVNFSIWKTFRLLHGSEVAVIFAWIGIVIVPWLKSDWWKASWSPMITLISSAVLAFFIVLIAPNHIAYNLQAFTAPAAVLVAMLLLLTIKSDGWSLKRVILLAAAMLIMSGNSIMRGFDLRVPGGTIAIADMQKLIDLCSGKEDTCVGFAPRHPVFCRDATDLYLGWDLWFLKWQHLPEKGKRPYLEMWAKVVPEMEKNPPKMIIDKGAWVIAHELSALSDDHYKRFSQLTQKHYKRLNVGDIIVFLRK